MSDGSACDPKSQDGQLDDPDGLTRPRPATILHFAVRFPPPDAAESQSQSQPERSYANSDRSSSLDPEADTCPTSPLTQSINLTFQHGFKASPDAPLGILVCANRIVSNLVPADTDLHVPDPAYDDEDTDVDDLARSFQHICVVDEPINLFPPPAYPPPCQPVGPRYLAQLLPAGPLSRPSPSRSSSPHTAETTVVVCHAPLAILDQMSSLLRNHIDAPLPLVVGTQDIVHKHYIVYPHAHGVPQQPRNVTVSVFIADIALASFALCDAVSRWATSTRSPVKHDLSVLCQTISTAGLELPSLWAQATAILLSSWPATYTMATLQLAMAVQELPMEGRAPELPEGGGMRDGSGTETSEQVLFYNATAQTFLR
ncbi:hypothetical protein K4K59_012086 [Colletotrichum sp. SAR11_240]|nr:hypothetical protein K4K59_012086 [Colletotrichum sp. SAR11_240]